MSHPTSTRNKTARRPNPKKEKTARRRRPVDPDAVEWRPNPGPQAAFFASKAFEIGYGGKKGGGKTEGILMDGMMRVARPGLKALYFRRTTPQLKAADGLIQRSQMVGRLAGGTYNGGDHVWTFRHEDGKPDSHMYFRHMEGKDDHLLYNGWQIQALYVDQAEEFTGEQYLFLFSLLRATVESGLKCRVRITFNPPVGRQPGKTWIKKRFAPWLDKKHPRPAKPGELRWFKMVGDEEVECKKGEPGALSRTFIPAGFEDNPKLDPDYIDKLNRLPPRLKRAYRDGDFDIPDAPGTVFDRKYFEDPVTLDPHHIVDDFPAEADFFVRYWDPAASEATAEYPDPDYTASCLMTIVGEDVYMRFDQRREKWARIKKWARQKADDEPDTIVYIEQEPGASGKGMAEDMVMHLAGVRAEIDKPEGDKETRAQPLASQAQVGAVYIVRNPALDTETIITQFHEFPFVDHDDLVDSASGAYKKAVQIKKEVAARAVRQKELEGVSPVFGTRRAEWEDD